MDVTLKGGHSDQSVSGSLLTSLLVPLGTSTECQVPPPPPPSRVALVEKLHDKNVNRFCHNSCHPKIDLITVRFPSTTFKLWEPAHKQISKASITCLPPLQNLAMFLSMLVAWMIPDVPRPLREQLKKENMMLMEFLLNQDQEAHTKSHAKKRSNPCLPLNIEIVVEAPMEEPEEVEISLNELRWSRDSDPEVGGSYSDPEEEERGSKENYVGAAVGEDNENDIGDGAREEVNIVQEKGKDKEDAEHRVEEETTENPAENFTVDLDSFMSELGLLGERRKHHDQIIIIYVG